MPESKGLALDDTTFQDCPGKIPTFLPNTRVRVKSLRLFKAWAAHWDDTYRLPAWNNLNNYLIQNDAKVLMGTQITCNETDDDRDWELVKEFLTLVGANHVMGVAIGNELELLYTYENITKECIHDLWNGYFLRKFLSRMEDLDALPGFKGIKVTSVFGGYALAGSPFIDTSDAKVLTFMRQVFDTKWTNQWAWTFNIYPYFDSGMWVDPGTSNKCTQATAASICFDNAKCMMVIVSRTARQRVAQFTGRQDDIFWLGETGWSHPQTSTLKSLMKNCAQWSARESFASFYENYMKWDMVLHGSNFRVDHVFYFTLRDSINFGAQEYFGLVPKCQDQYCKLCNGRTCTSQETTYDAIS